MRNGTRFIGLAKCDARLLEQPIAPCEILPNGVPGRLEINLTLYRVEILGYLPGQGEPIVDGYRLTKDNGEAHDLCLIAGRLECTCGDWIWRRSFQTDRHLADCKHCRAVKQLLALPIDHRPVLSDYSVEFEDL